MYKKIYNIIKRNKKLIIINIIISAVTFIILLSTFLILINTKVISFNGSYRNNFQIEKAIPTGSAAEESNIINVVEKANPAVISIVISKNVPIIDEYYQNYNPFSNLFNGFNVPRQESGKTEKKEIGGGSGFFISNDGYIVTNYHVVSDSEAEYTVLTNDGKRYDAKILAKDSTIDVAILKVEGKDFSYLSFADSDTIKLGQTAIAIGNALAEYQNSISMGIVSGLSRSIVAGDNRGGSESLDGIIQTDAAINPGNSGGPLLDIRGNVIGVNVAVQNGAENIGFALPSNIVKSIADSVRQNGEIIRPYLGVRFTVITEAIKKSNNLTTDYGVLVSRGKAAEDLAVLPGSPADKSGLVENDIILEIDGVKLTEERSLPSIIRQKSIGQTITLKVISKGTTKDVKVVLEKAPNNI